MLGLEVQSRGRKDSEFNVDYSWHTCFSVSASGQERADGSKDSGACGEAEHNHLGAICGAP